MLKDNLRQQFNEARKQKDSLKRGAIEAVLALILQKEKTEVGKVITDDEVLDCLSKEIKVQNEIFELYKEKDEDKSRQAKLKADILFEFLPKQFTEDEILDMIKELDVYEDNSNRTKGMIIKNLMPQIKGRFDKSKVNPLVEKYLSNK